jgi:hypothetical protein
MVGNPNSRADLEIIAADEGFVVHDASREVVHYLNQTAAIVLSLCDGRRSTDSIAELVKSQFDLDESPRDDVIEIVEKLEAQGLFQ